jgi:hypothetical protein
MKNSNLKNLLSKSGLKPIKGEVLTSIKGGKKPPLKVCQVKQRSSEMGNGNDEALS